MLNDISLRRLPVIPGKVIAVVLAAALLSGGIGLYRYRVSTTSGAVPYTTSKVQTGTISSTVTATGPISASSAVPLNFKNSGKLASISAKVGDQVTAGQVLATMDSTDLQSQVAQAQATLASAQAAYDKAVQGPTATPIAASKASVDAAGTQLS
jgi:HlyD family secretion protein